MKVSPDTLTTFAGGSVVLTLTDDSGTPLDLTAMRGVRVELYIPGDERRVMLVKDGSTGEIVATVPERWGTHEASVLLEAEGVSESADVEITVRALSGGSFTLTTNDYGVADSGLRADVYSPAGVMVATLPVVNGAVSGNPAPDWVEGIYRVVIRDAAGNDLDVLEVYVERTNYASAPTFWSLPEKGRLTLEYLKYTLMGDPDPVPPGALLTLEQYAMHWIHVVRDINFAIQTNVKPTALPDVWYETVLKGTCVRAFDYLANRAVTVPRFTGVPTLIQDESHLQGAWEARRNLIKPEYEREKYLMRRYHLPRPRTTVDAHFGMFGRGFGGGGVGSFIGRPGWFPQVGYTPSGYTPTGNPTVGSGGFGGFGAGG